MTPVAIAVVNDYPLVVPGGRFVVYTWNADARLVRTALDAGADGYLSKRVDGR